MQRWSFVNMYWYLTVNFRWRLWQTSPRWSYAGIDRPDRVALHTLILFTFGAANKEFMSVCCYKCGRVVVPQTLTWTIMPNRRHIHKAAKDQLLFMSARIKSLAIAFVCAAPHINKINSIWSIDTALAVGPRFQRQDRAPSILAPWLRDEHVDGEWIRKYP